MQFDDRLATVLRSGAAGERAARTQFRQLLDLLGSAPQTIASPLVEAAYAGAASREPLRQSAAYRQVRRRNPDAIDLPPPIPA